MTFGDKIRRMDDEELADMLIDSIDASAGFVDEYTIDLGGYHRFSVFDNDDLAEKLGEEIIE